MVRAFVTWPISHEGVDVAMQVREMLDKAQLEIEEALEVREGHEEDENREAEDSEERAAGGDGDVEVDQEVEEDWKAGQERGSAVIVNDESEEEDED